MTTTTTPAPRSTFSAYAMRNNTGAQESLLTLLTAVATIGTPVARSSRFAGTVDTSARYFSPTGTPTTGAMLGAIIATRVQVAMANQRTPVARKASFAGEVEEVALPVGKRYPVTSRMLAFLA